MRWQAIEPRQKACARPGDKPGPDRTTVTASGAGPGGHQIKASNALLMPAPESAASESSFPWSKSLTERDSRQRLYTASYICSSAEIPVTNVSYRMDADTVPNAAAAAEHVIHFQVGSELDGYKPYASPGTGGRLVLQASLIAFPEPLATSYDD